MKKRSVIAINGDKKYWDNACVPGHQENLKYENDNVLNIRSKRSRRKTENS